MFPNFLLLLRHCRIRKELSCEALGKGDYFPFTTFRFSAFLQKQKGRMKMHGQNNGYEKGMERYFWLPASQGKVIRSEITAQLGFGFFFFFGEGGQRQERKGLMLLLPGTRVWIFFLNLWVAIEGRSKRWFFRLWFCKLFQLRAPLHYILPSVPAENFLSLDLFLSAMRQVHRTHFSGTWVFLNSWEHAVPMQCYFGNIPLL